MSFGRAALGTVMERSRSWVPEPALSDIIITSSPNWLGAQSALTLACVNRVCLRIIFLGDVPTLNILVADDVINANIKYKESHRMTYKSFLFQLVELMFYEQSHLKILPMGIHSFIKGIVLFLVSAICYTPQNCSKQMHNGLQLRKFKS